MGRDRVDRAFELIGTKISEVRRANDMTPAELAHRCGLKRPSIVLIEAGKQFVPIDGLYRIARALGTEITDILPSVSEVFGSDKSEATDGFVLDGPSSARLSDDSIRLLESIIKKHE